MKKTATAKADTVEQAIEQALQLIGLTRDEVTVEILTNPGRRLIGLRKILAEVRVTEAAVKEQKIERITELIDTLIDEESVTANTAGHLSLLKQEHTKCGLRIVNGELQMIAAEEQNLVVVPHNNMRFIVNGEMITEETIISPSDEISMSVENEAVSSQFSIQLLEQEMIAMLHFTPGRKIIRSISDAPWTSRLRIDVKEETESFNDLQPQKIVDELKAMGIQQGLLFPAIKKATEVIKPYELIVARGTLPVEGMNGDLEIHIQYDEFDPDSDEKIDFREMNAISNVIEKQIIATHIKPVPGTNGRNLANKIIPAKPVKDILIRLGKNVKKTDDNILALISGKPVLEWRDRVVLVDVNHEFNHPGEVGLESGNIRFEGDVKIGGNVQPSMFVGATGSVFIGGSVTKSTIQAKKTAVIRGNVLSSVINVGETDHLRSELGASLEIITALLVQIKTAIQQIFQIRGMEEDELSPSELKRLIYALMEKKYAHFEDANRQFIRDVEANAGNLESGWTGMAGRLYDLFVNPLNENVQNIQEFDQIIEDAEAIIQLHKAETAPQSILELPYAINSTLYSNGNINITSKGVYHSTLSAEQDITIKGVCRGGEIKAARLITLQESGSETIVKTVLKTGEQGRIKIGKAYAGTEIMIGTRKHIFEKNESSINASLDEDGKLQVR